MVDGRAEWQGTPSGASAEEPHFCKDPLYHRNAVGAAFVVSLGRFRLSATSETGTPIAKAHGTRAEALLATGKLDEPSVLSYLKDVF